MNKFLRKIALFSAIVLLLFCCLEFVGRRLPNVYSKKNQYVASQAPGISTLILGTSHTYYGLNPAELGDSVFNLANTSQPALYDLALLEKWVPEMPNLKRVIIPISYTSFAEPDLEDTDEWQRAVQYKVYMHLPLHSDYSIYNLAFTDYNALFGRLRNLVLGDKQGNDCDSLGFGLGYEKGTEAPDWQEGGESRAQSHTFPYDKGVNEHKLQTYEDLIEYLKKRNIECILISTPTWPTYRAHLDQRQLRDMQEKTAYLVDKYGLRYYNYSASEAFDAGDFHDVDHLNDIGASKLSRLLRGELQTPLAESNQKNE